MKKSFTIITFVLTTFLSVAQQPPRLIIRADDMGYSHSGNDAIIKSYTDGIVTSVEVIVPSPWFPEAVKKLNQHPSLDVGVHLALTSEWDNIKWRPLTEAKSLRDSNGYFFPMVFANKNYPRNAILENNWTLSDVEREFRAQIEMAKKHIPRVSHISGHMGCTRMTAEVSALTNKLAKEYGLLSEDHNVTATMGFGAAKTPDESISYFIDWLGKLENGKTYIFLDHPGINNDELKAIHHIGYENVASDRQRVTDVFTNDRVKKLILEKNIQLTGYKELRNQVSQIPGTTVDSSYFVEAAIDIERAEAGPHKGGGNTMAYRYFKNGPGMLQFTRRVLQVGAAIGYHLQKDEEIYYIVSGTGEMRMNNKRFPVKAGDAILTMPGNWHSIAQTGVEPLIMIINYLK